MHSVRLEQALSAWPQWGEVIDEAPKLLRSLPGGLTNSSYLLQAGTQRLVLRLNADNTHCLGIDRAQEAAAWRAAAAAGLAPALVYVDPEYHYLVSDYLCSIPGTEAPAVEQVARLLKQVHSLPVQGRPLNIVERAQHYWRGLAGQQLPGHWRRAQQRLNDYFQRRATAELCFCHNDPVAQNLLPCSGRLYLIDWEYAAPGDPYFDLAAYAHSTALEPTEIKQLLNSYSDGVTEQEQQRYWQADFAYRYLEWLWLLVQGRLELQSEPAYREPLEAKLKQLLSCLQDLEG